MHGVLFIQVGPYPCILFLPGLTSMDAHDQRKRMSFGYHLVLHLPGIVDSYRGLEMDDIDGGDVIQKLNRESSVPAKTGNLDSGPKNFLKISTCSFQISMSRRLDPTLSASNRGRRNICRFNDSRIVFVSDVMI